MLNVYIYIQIIFLFIEEKYFQFRKPYKYTEHTGLQNIRQATLCLLQKIGKVGIWSQTPDLV